jgi:hydrogenase expression/formation protein HypC
MCLTIPGKVLSVEDADPAFRCGCVDFCGTRRIVNLAYTPDAGLGDYVLVHVGFAVTRIEPEEATRIFADLTKIGALENTSGD